MCVCVLLQFPATMFFPSTLRAPESLTDALRRTLALGGGQIGSEGADGVAESGGIERGADVMRQQRITAEMVCS